ncbi:MAG TPA: hypothetical protein VFL12_07685, partial [Thermoanaerobaculia bacterium]|nr:hypothetical protein [Thermoanaerobaculia bacterium]
SCTGPFTVNVGPGLPSLSSTPGSAFSMTGTSGSTGQQFSGSGTIPPGKFVGVNSVYPTAVAGTRQVVVTLNFGTGSQSVTLNTTLDFDVLPSRGDIQRQILHPVRTGVRRP